MAKFNNTQKSATSSQDCVSFSGMTGKITEMSFKWALGCAPDKKPHKNESNSGVLPQAEA
jgi:hypothetical protein